MKRTFLIAAAMATALSPLTAQDWVEMKQKGKNFYEIQQEFNREHKERDKEKEAESDDEYTKFKRWEHFMAPRVYPSGELWKVSTNWENFSRFSDPAIQSRSSSAPPPNWVAVGPMGAMTGLASNGFPRKAGRDNFVTFHPTSASTFWCGAPAGGLWKTTNGGATWSTNTDNLSVIGCSDLAIDPATPNTMYLATGDGDASDTYCIGVLKTTDGGLTWNSTGLTFAVSLQREMRRLIINPSNPQILLAATDAGVYRTSNGGTTWTQVSTFNAFDVEFKPGDPNTVYAAGTTFYLSTNGGTSFTQVSNGIPTSGANRMNIAVTPANAAYVYVLASSNANSGLLGVYRSVNSGAAFSTMNTAPDILANPCSSPSGGGQGWYDLAFAASPLNANEVVVGGVNAWRSTNGGSSFSIIGCWIGTGNPPYVHADHHELEYTGTGVLYSCNDGGIFSYNGSTWTDLTNPRNIAQIYKIGLSALSPSLWITGHQDNGSNIYNGTSYNASMAGDGMDCFIDRTNNSNMFASYYSGNFQRSTNGGASWNSAISGLSGNAAWVSPWKQDPSVATRLYGGWSQMFVSNNLGASWTQLTATGGSGNIVEFAVAASNNQVLYVIHGTSIRKSINGGTSWSNVTGTIPVGSAAPTFITISPGDPNKVWVTLSGYSAGNKVYYTANGGTSWTNVSANLPNLPANCSVYQPGTSDMVYVGMDVGVYYKDNSSGTWTIYNAALPNVPIADMEISPANPTKLRAATYGRGVYEVDVMASNSVPQSNFSFSGSICSGVSKVFNDNSGSTPTAWSWSVNPSGAAISNSAAQNPTITFAAAGIYTVTMVASNTVGSGSPSSQTVTVNASPTVAVSVANTVVCINDNVTMDASGAGTYTWYPILLTGPTQTINTSMAQTLSYTVSATAANGCKGTQIISVEVSECTALKDAGSASGSFNIYPNPANSKLSIRYNGAKNTQALIEISDATGKLVLRQEAVFRKDRNETQLNISNLASGVYMLKIIPAGEQEQVMKLIRQ